MLRSRVATALTLIFAPALLVVTASYGVADDYPSRPLRIFQGFAPGGNADIISRVIGEELQKSLGQSIIYESRPGAGGNLATETVARAEPDGYTMVLLTTGHSISAALYKSLKFDPVNDFRFISTVSEIPFFFVTNAKSRFQTMAQLVEAARTKPDAVTFGTAGVGTGQHLTAETFASAVGVKMLHVPFRGDSAAVTALLSGDVDIIVAPGTAIFSNIEGGALRALGISSNQRWPQLGNVPTLAEAVAPGFELVGWSGVAMPRGVPQAVVDRINRDVTRIVALPAVSRKLQDMGNIARASTADDFTKRVASDIARWNGVIDKAGIQRQ